MRPFFNTTYLPTYLARSSTSCLGPAEAAAFEAAILEPGALGFHKITAAFAVVDVGSAEAGNERDKAMIMEQAEAIMAAAEDP